MKKSSSGAILAALAPSKDSGPTLQKQLYGAIRNAILEGGLPPGTRLPSSRALASEWGLGRNTIVIAFEHLAAEGYLESRTGAGTFVSRRLPEEFIQATRTSSRPKGRPTDGVRPVSSRGRQLAAVGYRVDAGRPRPLLHGVPALDAFPVDVWRKLTSRVTRRITRSMLNSQRPGGFEPLKRNVASYLNTARGVRCDWRQVLIVASSQQAVDLAAKTLLDPGESVWVEEPGYRGAKAAFTSAQARMVPIPVDRDGLQIEDAIQRAPESKMIYVTPSHQYPLGVMLSLPRRLQLLEWAATRNAWILEDDYDSEFRYAGRPLAALQGLDEAGCVIYMGTFSKVLFPSLRLAYLVVPEGLVDHFEVTRALLDGHSPGISQAVLSVFIEEGHFAAHIRRMRNLYRERRDTLRQALEDSPEVGLHLLPSDSGMHLIGLLDPHRNDIALTAQARLKGLAPAPLSECYLADRGQPGFILGYCSVPRHEIRRGARVFLDVLREPSRAEANSGA